MNERPQTRLFLAILAIVIASFLNALMGAVVKYLSEGLTIESMVFWRNLVCLFLILPWLLLHPPRHYSLFKTKIKPHKLSLHLIRSLSGLAAIYLFYLSLQYLSLSDATLLANTIPIFIPLTAFFWKKIPIIHRLWWGIGIAFAGILVIMQPGLGVFHFASFIGLAGSICGSIAVFALRQAHFSEPPIRTLFYFFLIASIIAGLGTLPRLAENWQFTGNQILVLVGLGCLGLAYQICFTFGAKWAPVRLTSSFMYLSVVFSMVLQWVVWSQPVALSSILGLILVFIGASLVIYLYPKNQI